MPVYTYTNLDDPLVPGGAFAHGINNAGQIVGGYIGASRNGGFLYSGGTFTALDDPLGADGTTAFGINNAGQIVGDYFDASNNLHSFFYVGGTFSILDDPLGTLGTFANGINDAGQIVGQYRDANGKGHGFLYDPSRGVFPPTSPSTTPQAITPLPATSTTQVRSSGST